MKQQRPDAEGPVAPGLIQLDEKTLVSVKLARSGQPPDRFRAVAVAALRARHRVPLSSSETAGFGPDPETALEACLRRVRTALGTRPAKARRLERRPQATL
jgi:hypothetical protein